MTGGHRQQLAKRTVGDCGGNGNSDCNGNGYGNSIENDANADAIYC